MSVEDMALTPISETDLPFSTTEQVGASAQAQAQTMQTVELSFSTLPGGAWDDRELIQSSQAAMSEFHAHHPGPGSWLDKATAALAAGKPLPGSEAFDTAWYTAVTPVVPVEETSATTLGPVQPPNKKARRDKPKSNGNAIQNPYTNQQSQSQSRSGINARESPTYTPPSPRPHANGNITVDMDDVEDADVEEEEEEEYDEDAEWDIQYYPTHAEKTHTNSDFIPPIPAPGRSAAATTTAINGNGIGPSPSLGVQPAVSKDDALGYAMTAQYWAGYWMGVAQSQSQPQPQGAGNTSTQEGSVPSGASGSKGNKRSRQDQNQNQNGRSINGLLR